MAPQDIRRHRVVRVEGRRATKRRGRRRVVSLELAVGERFEHRHIRPRLVEFLRGRELAQAIGGAGTIEIQPAERQMHLECESRLGGADVGRHRRLVLAEHRIPLAERT